MVVLLRRLFPLLVAAALASACTGSTEATDEGGAAASTTLPAPATTEPRPQSCPNGIEPVHGAASSEAPPTLTGSFEPAVDVGGPAVLDIGVLLPVSGALAHLAPPQLAAVELAIADVNDAGGVLGAAVTMSVVDAGSGGDERAGQAAQRLVEAGVDVVIGGASEATTLAVIDQVTDAGVVLFSAHNDAPAFTDYEDDGRYFRTSASDVLQGRALAGLIRADGAEEVTVVARDDGYGRPIAEALRAEAARAGLDVDLLAYDPSHLDADELASSVVDADPDAVAVVGLLESAQIIDALAAAERPPHRLPTYGVGGNTGERLAELVEAPHVLACARGLVPAAPTPPAFRRRLLAHDPTLVDLTHAAETYDAVVIAALAAQLAGSAEPAAIATAIPAVTRDGVPCGGPRRCLELLRDPQVRVGEDIDLDGRGGRYELSLAGEPTVATFRVAQFGMDGALLHVGARTASSP